MLGQTYAQAMRFQRLASMAGQLSVVYGVATASPRSNSIAIDDFPPNEYKST